MNKMIEREQILADTTDDKKLQTVKFIFRMFANRDFAIERLMHPRGTRLITYWKCACVHHVRHVRFPRVCARERTRARRWLIF